jgi:hypothetical protein
MTTFLGMSTRTVLHYAYAGIFLIGVYFVRGPPATSESMETRNRYPGPTRTTLDHLCVLLFSLLLTGCVMIPFCVINACTDDDEDDDSDDDNDEESDEAYRQEVTKG